MNLTKNDEPIRCVMGTRSVSIIDSGQTGWEGKPTCRQLGDDDVVDVRARKSVRAAVVFEGGDDPALRFDR